MYIREGETTEPAGMLNAKQLDSNHGGSKTK
jgi:hypothetical protein